MAAVEVGDIASRVSHVTIVDDTVDEHGSPCFVVQNEGGKTWRISKDIFNAECRVAGTFTEEKKVTLAELERVFRSIGEDVFKVTFTKEPDVDAGVAAIDAAVADWPSLPAGKKRKLVREKLHTGETRVLKGRLDIDAFRTSARDPESCGRMKVIDMEAPAGHRIRLVNVRTVSELIVGGVRYHRKV